MIIELSITIEIKVTDEEYEVFWGDLSVSVLSFKLAEFLRANEASCISINSLECGIGLEVPNGC